MKNHLRRICLVGVRGVGKSTLVRSVIQHQPEFDYIVGSAVLRELAGDDFTRFDYLPPQVKNTYRYQAIDWMERRQAELGLNILCDGHTSLLDESTGVIGPVFTERDCQFFRELILFEAPAKVVLSRRRNDPAKKRSLDIETIEMEIAGERTTSERLAKQWGMALHCLDYEENLTLSKKFLELLSS